MDASKSIDGLKLKLSKSDDILLSLTPVLFTLASLFLLYKTNLTQWYNSTPYSPSRSSRVEINLLFIAIGLLGIYMFYKKDEILRLTPVYSNLDIKKKSAIINTLISPFKLTPCKTDHINFREFYLIRGFFSLSMDLDIVILTDEKGFYINVTDMNKRWIFSWGTYEHWTTKIKSAIETELVKYQ